MKSLPGRLPIGMRVHHALKGLTMAIVSSRPSHKKQLDPRIKQSALPYMARRTTDLLQSGTFFTGFDLHSANVRRNSTYNTDTKDLQ